MIARLENGDPNDQERKTKGEASRLTGRLGVWF